MALRSINAQEETSSKRDAKKGTFFVCISGPLAKSSLLKGRGIQQMQLGCAMKLLPAPATVIIVGTFKYSQIHRVTGQFRPTVGYISMSLLDSEKWLLVEWGNGVRGVVHSRYMVNKTKSDLKTGCTITISKRGEQQLATYIARSNDRKLLEQIAGNEAGPSVPPDPEPELNDFSSSGSDWKPSGDEGSDSEMEIKKQRMDVVYKGTPREKRSKKVIKPTNKVKAIIPNTIRRSQQMNMKTYVNCRKRPLESSTYVHENNNTQPNNENKVPSNNLHGPSRLVTATFDMNLVVGILGAMNKLVKGLAMLKGESSPNRVANGTRDKMLVVEEIDKENSHSDESNRSDDNVLISNKYVNIENNVQEHESLTEGQQSIANITQHNTMLNTLTVYDFNETENGQEQIQANEIVENTLTEETLNTKQYKILSDTLTQKNIAPNTRPQKNSNSTQQQKAVDNVQGQSDDNEWVPIGSGKTLIHKDKFKKVKWSSYTVATRTLLLALFPRRTLATHSLTGKKSPAFQNKPAKMCLDPKKITDIIIEVMDRFDVKENLVRGVITTKCADESKMFRTRMEKKKNAIPKMQNVQMQENFNKENS